MGYTLGAQGPLGFKKGARCFFLAWRHASAERASFCRHRKTYFPWRFLHVACLTFFYILYNQSKHLLMWFLQRLLSATPTCWQRLQLASPSAWRWQAASQHQLACAERPGTSARESHHQGCQQRKEVFSTAPC